VGVAQARYSFFKRTVPHPLILHRSRRVSVPSGAQSIQRDHEYAGFFGRHLVKHWEYRACSIKIISSPSKIITEKRSRIHSNSGTALQTGGPRLPIPGVLGPPGFFGTRAHKYAFTRHNSGVPCRKLAACVPKFRGAVSKTLVLYIGLQTPNPLRVPVSYSLTKIHKPTPVGRPIVAGNDGPTERLSAFVDSILQSEIVNI